MVCDTAACFILSGIGFWAAARGAAQSMRVVGLVLVMLGALYVDAGVQSRWVTVTDCLRHIPLR